MTAILALFKHQPASGGCPLVTPTMSTISEIDSPTAILVEAMPKSWRGQADEGGPHGPGPCPGGGGMGGQERHTSSKDTKRTPPRAA